MNTRSISFFGIVLLFFATHSAAQHTLDFIIPPCPTLAIATPNNNVPDFTVFPNPATDRLRLSLGQHVPVGELDVLIYDLMGRKVFEKQFQRFDHETSIDISSLQAGMFFLGVRFDGTVRWKIFVVARE